MLNSARKFWKKNLMSFMDNSHLHSYFFLTFFVILVNQEKEKGFFMLFEKRVFFFMAFFINFYTFFVVAGLSDVKKGHWIKFVSEDFNSKTGGNRVGGNDFFLFRWYEKGLLWWFSFLFRFFSKKGDLFSFFILFYFIFFFLCDVFQVREKSDFSKK